MLNRHQQDTITVVHSTITVRKGPVEKIRHDNEDSDESCVNIYDLNILQLITILIDLQLKESFGSLFFTLSFGGQRIVTPFPNLSSFSVLQYNNN